MEDSVEKPLMRAFRIDLIAGGALQGLACGAASSACCLLAARAFLSPLPAKALAVFACIPAFIAACVARALARAPSRAKCLALVEDASHAGGLILAGGVPGADKWKAPPPVTPRVTPTWRRALPGALVSILALAAVSAAPDSWFAAGAQPAPAPAFPDVTAEIRNELAELQEAKALDAEEIESLKEELARIEKEADPSTPGETLDAVDAVREKLDALLDMDAQAAKHILPEFSSFASLATNPKAAEQLRQMLDESSAGKCSNCGRPLGHGEGECDGNCAGEGEGEGEGEGDMPGSGGLDRGRGDANLHFGNESELGQSQLKDLAEKAELTEKSQEQKVGESVSDEDPSMNAPHPRSGAERAIGGRNSGTSVNSIVLPRHRGTVKRFFETEKRDR